MEKATNTYAEEMSLSDDDNDDGVLDIRRAGRMKTEGTTGVRGTVRALGPVEEYAESCDIYEAGHFLRKAKLACFAASTCR